MPPHGEPAPPPPPATPPQLSSERPGTIYLPCGSSRAMCVVSPAAWIAAVSGDIFQGHPHGVRSMYMHGMRASKYNSRTRACAGYISLIASDNITESPLRCRRAHCVGLGGPPASVELCAALRELREPLFDVGGADGWSLSTGHTAISQKVSKICCAGSQHSGQGETGAHRNGQQRTAFEESLQLFFLALRPACLRAGSRRGARA